VEGLSLIVAMTRRGVIGRGGGLPWKLSADLKRFKALTMGHHLLMGRKTYESLGRPLPGRMSIVLKRLSSPYDFDFLDEHGRSLPLYSDVIAARLEGKPVPDRFAPIAFARNWSEAIQLTAADFEPFVIGGSEIFALALPHVSRLYVTWVEADVDGDTFFPDWNPAEWRLVESQPHSADAKNEYDTTFCIYDRIPL
jgi:dihydrofolate reductase